jgi:hypothetical protein
MLNPENMKEIVFPHTFGNYSWPGRQYVWNDVNGGAKSIGAFGYITNHFLGGRCVKLGFITELGFFGCQDKNHPEGTAKLIGFHVEDPSLVTAMGKELLEGMYRSNTIRYIRYDNLKKKPVDMAERAKAEQEAREVGVPEPAIRLTHVETLKDLVRVAKFEQLQEEAVSAPVKKAPARRPAAKKAGGADEATALLKQAAKVKVSIQPAE